MNIIGSKYIFLAISALLIVAAVTSIAVFGLKEGIDFVGGTAWQIKFDQPATTDAIKTALAEEFGLTNIIIIEESSTNSFIVRAPVISEGLHQQYRGALEKKLGALEELSFETIGPAVGSELRQKAIYAFISVLFAISLYIAFAFRKVSHPVSSWKYGIITLVTLFHDALIPLGLFSFLAARYGAELNTNIVVALLVVMGFSVHDTIVVFDRVRENIKRAAFAATETKDDFAGLVNKSVNETIVRSINTSLTLIIVLCALLFFGSANLQYFILTILVGVIVGTYSSIFIASPALVLWKK